MRFALILEVVFILLAGCSSDSNDHLVLHQIIGPFSLGANSDGR